MSPRSGSQTGLFFLLSTLCIIRILYKSICYNYSNLKKLTPQFENFYLPNCINSFNSHLLCARHCYRYSDEQNRHSPLSLQRWSLAGKADKAQKEVSGDIIKHLSKCYEHIQQGSVREKKAEVRNLKPIWLHS